MRQLHNAICIVDAGTAGVSGDKYLGALVDLGGTVKTLETVANVVRDGLPGVVEVNVTVSQVERGEIGAKLVKVESKEEDTRRKASVLKEAVNQCAKKLGLSDWGVHFSSSTIETLAEAESRVHNESSSSVKLHELGSVDTLVDVLGTACLIEELGLEKCKWVSTSVAVGSGSSHFSGRDYPNPPPAVLEILKSRKFAITPGPVRHELTTPTGAAITVNLASQEKDSYPALRPEKVGYGAGSQELEQVANIARIIVGAPVETSEHDHDRVVLLETNLDDVTGEVVGRAMEQVMKVGARDVTVTPVFMKKNRPGYMISVIANAVDAEKLADVIMAETGTLGVRQIPVSRHISLRRERKLVFKVRGRNYPLTTKIALDSHGRVVGEKPEYEALKKISKDTGLTVQRLQQLVKPLLDKGNERQP